MHNGIMSNIQDFKNAKQNAIVKDAFDEMVFEPIKETARFQPLCEKSVQQEALVQDIFNSLYKMNPELAEKAPMAQRGIVDQMMQLPEYQQLHALTQMDDVSAAMGALKLAPGLLNQFQEIQEKVAEKTRQAKKAGQPAPNTLEEALSADEMAGMRGALRKVAEDAQGDAEQWMEAANSWGVQKGELQHMDFADKFALAEQIMNTPKMHRIADMMGRFKNIVHSSSATVKMHGSDEIVDIGLGSDLSRMLPTELLKLDQMPELFYKDMVEGKLAVYNLKGVQNQGKGPIITCLDISSSMSIGNRDEWAKAVTLSLQYLTEKQKRGFGVVTFEGHVVETAYYPRENPPTMQDKMWLAGIQSNGGGTCFYEPLMAAFKMRENDKELKPADIVFITDGHCSLSAKELAEIQRLKKETNVRIFGIGIQCSTDCLQLFCDQLAIVNSLDDIRMEDVKKVILSAAADQMKKGA